MGCDPQFENAGLIYKFYKRLFLDLGQIFIDSLMFLKQYQIFKIFCQYPNVDWNFVHKNTGYILKMNNGCGAIIQFKRQKTA